MSNAANHYEFYSFNYEKDGHIRYYSLARHALINAFKLIGIHSGSRVLLPSFLCRDVLAAVNMLGAISCWYEVDQDLSPLLPPEFWPSADIVLMVNYFGFPQNITPFRIYAERTRAVIIEDNAHGFLSRDQDGGILGCRSDLGIFSIRKTIRIPDGAALWIRSVHDSSRLPVQLPFKGAGVNPAQLKKFYIRSLPIVGEFLFRLLTKSMRMLRTCSSAGKKTFSDAEISLLIPPEPWHGLLSSLKILDVQAEIERRRSSYLKCLEECEKNGGLSVFSFLPSHCVPYAYAFRGNQKVVSAMQRYANQHGFDMVSWPDLPSVIVNKAPEYYRNIFLINLAW